MPHNAASLLPTLTLAVPSLIFASTYVVGKFSGLMVYHSVLIELTDKFYKPISDFVWENKLRLAFSDTTKDEGMYFGSGVLKLYSESGSLVPPPFWGLDPASFKKFMEV